MVSSSFRLLYIDGSLLQIFISCCTIMASNKCQIIGKQVVVIFLTSPVTIATV